MVKISLISEYHERLMKVKLSGLQLANQKNKIVRKWSFIKKQFQKVIFETAFHLILQQWRRTTS